MSQILQPARVAIPGNILKRELEARGWTQNDLAAIIGRPPQVISEIISGVKQITPETACELAEAFGTSPDFWMNLETNYRLHLLRKKEEKEGNRKQDEKEIARKSRLYNLTPVTELIKRSWIRATNSVEELEREVCIFLDISSPDDIPQLKVNFRHTKERGPELNNQIAWLKRVEHLLKAQAVANFELERLKEAIPDILTLSATVEDIRHIAAKLLSLGVHFVIVPHLPKTFIDGATFVYSGNPVVAMTLRYDRIDAFWFTLLHELAHIVLAHKKPHLDSLYGSNEEEVDKQEMEANEKARTWLFEPEAFFKFVQESKPYFSQAKIERFARSQMRHPGIIVGQLQYDKHVAYNHLRSSLVKVSPFLTGLD